MSGCGVPDTDSDEVGMLFGGCCAGNGGRCDRVVNVGAHDSVNALQDGLADCVDSCPKDTNNDADGDGICGDVDR